MILSLFFIKFHSVAAPLQHIFIIKSTELFTGRCAGHTDGGVWC